MCISFMVFCGFDKQDSHCTLQEQEVPDDVKREMLKERCKGVAILSCKSEAMGAPCYVYLIGTAHVSEVFTHYKVFGDFWSMLIHTFLELKCLFYLICGRSLVELSEQQSVSWSQRYFRFIQILVCLDVNGQSEHCGDVDRWFLWSCVKSDHLYYEEHISR